ncbi:MAG: TIM barrel protein [Planctomycetota bacterium]
MNILFGKSIWEMLPCETLRFLDRAQSDGFDAVEMLPSMMELPPEQFIQHCHARGLLFIAQILTEGDSPAGHLRYLERWIERAAECGPCRINMHTGKDYFSFQDNLRLFERAGELAQRVGIPIMHETHRSRALFSAPAAAQFFVALPNLRIAADFSHWMVVHESDLSDQPEAMELALSRADYIHARVGFAEGPQVPHPLAPEWAHARDRHVELWRQILASRRAKGLGELIVTPEFGPVPYMPTLPFTAQPVADAWRVNVEFRNWLREHLI